MSLLSDLDARAAEVPGCSLTVLDDLQREHKEQSRIDLEVASGRTPPNLPRPTVFVVSTNSFIQFTQRELGLQVAAGPGEDS